MDGDLIYVQTCKDLHQALLKLPLEITGEEKVDLSPKIDDVSAKQEQKHQNSELVHLKVYEFSKQITTLAPNQFVELFGSTQE